MLRVPPAAPFPDAPPPAAAPHGRGRRRPRAGPPPVFPPAEATGLAVAPPPPTVVLVMVGPDEAAPPALNAPVMKGSGQFDAVGGAGSVPVMRPTASKSAWTRLSGRGEYPSLRCCLLPRTGQEFHVLRLDRLLRGRDLRLLGHEEVAVGRDGIRTRLRAVEHGRQVLLEVALEHVVLQGDGVRRLADGAT